MDARRGDDDSDGPAGDSDAMAGTDPDVDGLPGSDPDGLPGSDPDANIDMGEPAGLVGITALHNQVRATVGVGPMTWNPALAATAQAWAESCTDNAAPAGLIDHNPNRSDDHPYYVGENVFGSSGQATAEGAVNSWAAEAASYDYDSNTCAAGQICGHYTQIVWADSVDLGCGIADCPNLQFGSTIVCNYGPGGNINGQRPY